METTRQNKIARLLQKELSDIFLLQTKSMPGILISVSAVRISPDMSVARAYLSIFPSEKSEEIVKNINGNMKSIRFELGTRVRHQLRIIPELKFFVDDSLDTSVKKALDDLKEGETSDVIETDSALYIVRLDSETDKDATEKNRQNIIDKRKSDHYNEVLEGWQKKDGWKVNKKNVAKISFKNSLTQQDPNASTETQTSTETQNAESTQ